MPSKSKLYLTASLKAFIWLVVSAGFGLASIAIYVFSAKIFSTTQTESINDFVIIFLCLALTAGAGIDFVISSRSMSFGGRMALFSWNVITLLVAYILFTPNNINKPNGTVLDISTMIFSFITLGYCLGCKGNLFYEEDVIKYENKRSERLCQQQR
ncbi:MAG: hypothetical protein JO072_06045 [Parafilimonas sp.]|nr:hypothetical protein [Parafilimonas sp.]